MNCSNCGKTSPRTSNFCNYCGAEFLDKKFSRHASDVLYKPKKYYDFQTPIFLAVCILIVAMIIIIIVPAIKSFAANKFRDSTFVYASVERTYKEKCIEKNFEGLENQKGSSKDIFVKVKGRVTNMTKKDQSMIFEVSVTQLDDSSYTDTIKIEYNDILEEVDEKDVIIFWGKDNSCGKKRKSYKNEDPRISVEYINIINQMAFI